MSLSSHDAHSSMTSSKERRSRPRSAHSQTSATRHSFCRSAALFLISRSRFASIFWRQKSRRVAGRRKRWQSWPCQKHPFAKIAARYFGKARSGLPGRSFTCNRNRKPFRCKALRNSSSGLVFFPRIPAIIRLRTAGSTMSAIYHLCELSRFWSGDPKRSAEMWLHGFRDELHDGHNDRISELAIRLRIRNRNLPFSAGRIKAHKACALQRS